MIVYQPNKHFFQDILSLTKSWTMVKIFRGVGLIGIYTFLVCSPMLLVDFGLMKEKDLSWLHIQGIDPTVFSFLGIVLSILLVFRTNSAYDRWWEGRKQWGALVNNCRNLAIMAHTIFPKADQDSRKYMAIHISNFCIAFKEHLRQGAKLEELISVPKEEMEVYKTKKHVPNYISYQINAKIQEVANAGAISNADHINIKSHWASLLDILGACERIKKTPIPFSYAVYIRIFIVLYGLLLPFAIMSVLGMWTVPIVMMIFFAFLGVELMAAEIEDPFGLDCNDLPTGTIAHAIKDNVFEILEVETRQLEHKEAELYEKIF